MYQLLATHPSGGLLLARVLLGLVMAAHGAQKAFGWFGGPGPAATLSSFEQMGVPPVFTALVILAELLGGIGLVLGALTRIAAAGILAVMLGAVLMVHLPMGFFMNWGGEKQGEGFEFHLLAIGLATALLVEGAGAFSVDRALLAARREAVPREVVIH